MIYFGHANVTAPKQPFSQQSVSHQYHAPYWPQTQASLGLSVGLSAENIEGVYPNLPGLDLVGPPNPSHPRVPLLIETPVLA